MEEFRFACGKKMGERDRAEVDCACGIPDSGIGMALGYAAGKGVPYQRAISKYTSYMAPELHAEQSGDAFLGGQDELIANRDMLKDKRVLFCDDSIVRGTQLRDNTKILFDYGAKEVHMRIACPPLIYGCPFIQFHFVEKRYGVDYASADARSSRGMRTRTWRNTRRRGRRNTNVWWIR